MLCTALHKFTELFSVVDLNAVIVALHNAVEWHFEPIQLFSLHHQRPSIIILFYTAQSKRLIDNVVHSQRCPRLECISQGQTT